MLLRAWSNTAFLAATWAAAACSGESGAGAGVAVAGGAASRATCGFRFAGFAACFGACTLVCGSTVAGAFAVGAAGAGVGAFSVGEGTVCAGVGVGVAVCACARSAKPQIISEAAPARHIRLRFESPDIVPIILTKARRFVSVNEFGKHAPAADMRRTDFSSSRGIRRG